MISPFWSYYIEERWLTLREVVCIRNSPFTPAGGLAPGIIGIVFRLDVERLGGLVCGRCVFGCRRLRFVLGESLEAATPGWLEYKNGLASLEDALLSSTPADQENPPRAGQWQGLAGWLWVTQVLENILERFQDINSF